jgi:hypothetical protein
VPKAPERFRENKVKRRSGYIVAGFLTVLIAGMGVGFFALWDRPGCVSHVSFHCGLLTPANDPFGQFLDGSGRVFQQGSWHKGNATRTWGETYGIKLRRFCLTMQVTHINPRVTPVEARED